MNSKIKKRLKRTFILCVIGLLAGAGIGWMQIQRPNATVVQKSETSRPVAGIKVGGPFNLTDHNLNRVKPGSYADKYKLIYFGFASCPAICPAELAKMTKALNTLGAEADTNIQPLFITVDPERDTAAALKSYLSLFHPKIIGLTGSKDQIATTLKQYRIFAAKRQDPGATDYTMDHSSFIYFINPGGDLLSIYRTEDTAETMAAEIGKILESPERTSAPEEINIKETKNLKDTPYQLPIAP